MPLFRHEPKISVVVVAYQMQREVPRTVTSLLPPYQGSLGRGDVEVIVVDNASPSPLGLPPTSGVRVIRTEKPSRSPAAAANLGISQALGARICVILDGARLVTPNAISMSIRALDTFENSFATTMAWHLGPKHQSLSIREGYDSATEDALLDNISFPADGYRLFDISSLAGSNLDGFLGSLNESCCLTMWKSDWEAVGGFDERFQEPGGGYVNLELFERLIGRGMRPVLLLGEGSFHQVHGGASTGGGKADLGVSFSAEYQRITGRPYCPPEFRPMYIGGLPEPSKRFVFPNPNQA